MRLTPAEAEHLVKIFCPYERPPEAVQRAFAHDWVNDPRAATLGHMLAGVQVEVNRVLYALPNTD